MRRRRRCFTSPTAARRSGGAYAIAGGIAPALDYLTSLSFTEDDVAYLATLTDATKGPLFPADFLAYLRNMTLSLTVDCVPEGALVFPHEPIVRVRGPILQAQIVETALLDIVNFQTLIATKASRVVSAARGAPVVEFGLRRSQGIDGGLAASRASYIGGCAGTSNVLAGKRFGIPVVGTHAHAWVMFHQDELHAFRAYADALPGNCTFLVDTYDTLDGVARAIEVGKELRAKGYPLLGVRLDSGDLAYLSIEARRMLDAAGFSDTKVVASNDLDEHVIGSLLEQGAKIDVYGVGTRLVTAYDQPALGGVYKLGATRQADGTWREAIKLSEQPIKISNPGVLQVRRLRGPAGELVGDVIYDSEVGFSGPVLHDIEDPTRPALSPGFATAEDLLVTYLDRGRVAREPDPLPAARERAARDLAALSIRSRRFMNPQPYPVGLDHHVHTRKQQLIAAAREQDV